MKLQCIWCDQVDFDVIQLNQAENKPYSVLKLAAALRLDEVRDWTSSLKQLSPLQ